MQKLNSFKDTAFEAVTSKVTAFKPYAPIIGGLALGSIASLLTDTKIRGKVTRPISTFGTDISGRIQTMTSGSRDMLGGWLVSAVEQARSFWEGTGLTKGASSSEDRDEHDDGDADFSADNDSDNLMDDIDVRGADNRKKNVSSSKRSATSKHVH